MSEATPKSVPGKTVFTPVNSLIAAVIAGIAFAVLSIWVSSHGNTVPGFDRSIHSWVMAHRNSSNIRFARIVTWGGVTTIVLPLLIVIALIAAEVAHTFTRRLRTGVLIAIVASAGAYLGIRINHLQGRVRPQMSDWAGSAGGPSFPSGHTTVATIFAASCAWLIASRLRPGWPTVLLWSGAIIYALAVGLSRIWLGVHWPTDVLGGWLYGITWLAVSAAVVLAIRKRRARLLVHKS